MPASIFQPMVNPNDYVLDSIPSTTKHSLFQMFILLNLKPEILSLQDINTHAAYPSSAKNKDVIILVIIIMIIIYSHSTLCLPWRVSHICTQLHSVIYFLGKDYLRCLYLSSFFIIHSSIHSSIALYLSTPPLLWIYPNKDHQWPLTLLNSRLFFTP